MEIKRFSGTAFKASGVTYPALIKVILLFQKRNQIAPYIKIKLQIDYCVQLRIFK